MDCASVRYGGFLAGVPVRRRSHASAGLSTVCSRVRRSTGIRAAEETPWSTGGLRRPELDENPEGIISGEWPENFSLLSYEDLRAYIESQILDCRDRQGIGVSASATLGEVMSSPVRVATTEQTVEEIDFNFNVVSGLPVVDGYLRCIGVVSKKDIERRAFNGLQSKVAEVMSTPAITLTPNKTVLDAAALMLKTKIHRIPVVNNEGQVLGIVTRTDVFEALESPGP